LLPHLGLHGEEPRGLGVANQVTLAEIEHRIGEGLKLSDGARLDLGVSAPERGEDLVVLGEPPGFLLGEDPLPVANDVELALGAGEVGRFDAVGVQLGRETRGPLVIARSGRAVVDLDSHGGSLPVPAAAPLDAAVEGPP
jgi:hypothetical protein